MPDHWVFSADKQGRTPARLVALYLSLDAPRELV
jgi:hypothetical protein